MKKILVVVVLIIGVIILLNLENISKILRLNSKEHQEKINSASIMVPVASRDLEAGQIILQSDVKVISVSASLVDEKVILNINKITDKKTSRKIEKDDYFYEEDLK